MNEACRYCEYRESCEQGFGPFICPYGVYDDEDEYEDLW